MNEIKDYELDASMRWLFHHGTALIVMSNIIGKFGLRRMFFFSDEEMMEDETIFCPKDLKTTRPRLSMAQILGSIKKLEKFGFLKVIRKDYNYLLLKVIINPFDRNVSKTIADSEYYGSGYCWFK